MLQYHFNHEVGTEYARNSVNSHEVGKEKYRPTHNQILTQLSSPVQPLGRRRVEHELQFTTGLDTAQEIMLTNHSAA